MEPAIFAAIRTIKAPWYSILLARLFGQVTEYRDNGKWVKVAQWRGRAYMLDASE